MSKLPRTKLVANPDLPRWVRVVRDANKPRIVSPVVCTSPSVVVAALADQLISEEIEVMIVVLLDTQRRMIMLSEISRGGLDSTIVDVRSTYRLAIAANAAGIVTLHNHPSGEMVPSRDDELAWSQLNAAGRVLGIHPMDHLIVGSDPMTGAVRYYSLSEHGGM